MGQRLAFTIHLPDDGAGARVYRKGTPYSAALGKVITGAHAWEDDGAGAPAAPAAATPPRPAVAVLGDDDSGAQTSSVQAPSVQAPPRSGAGSGTEAWATYATSLGVAVPDGAKKTDIIALLEQRGLLGG